MALSIPLLVVVYTQVFGESLGNGFTPVPSGIAFVYALFVGLFIPLFSATVPVMSVLG